LIFDIWGRKFFLVIISPLAFLYQAKRRKMIQP